MATVQEVAEAASKACLKEHQSTPIFKKKENQYENNLIC